MEWTLGVLIYSGHDPDHMLDRYSLEQIALFAKCSLTHQVRMLDMLLSPLLGAQGIEYKEGKVDGGKGKTNADRTPEELQAKEDALLRRFGGKVRIKTVQTSEGEAS